MTIERCSNETNTSAALDNSSGRLPALVAVFVLLGAVAWQPGTAVAQEAESPEDETDDAKNAKRAKKSFEEGMEHYVEEDYSKAIVDFKRAHNLYPSAMLLYNIAMARMNQGNHEKAAGAARDALEFDGKPLPNENRAQARGVTVGHTTISSAFRRTEQIHRREREKKKETKEPKAERSEDETTEDSDRHKDATASGETEPPSDDSTDVGDSESSGAALGALGWTGIAVGGLGVLGSAGIPILASKYSRDIARYEELSTGPSRSEFEAQRETVRSTRQTGQILQISGPSLAVVGGGLLLADLLSGSSQKTASAESRISVRLAPAERRVRLEVSW